MYTLFIYVYTHWSVDQGYSVASKFNAVTACYCYFEQPIASEELHSPHTYTYILFAPFTNLSIANVLLNTDFDNSKTNCKQPIQYLTSG